MSKRNPIGHTGVVITACLFAAGRIVRYPVSLPTLTGPLMRLAKRRGAGC